MTLAPNFADAALLLADLNIKSGAAQPAIQYHLGMTAAAAGDKELARQAHSIAAAPTTPCAGQDEAKKALAAPK